MRERARLSIADSGSIQADLGFNFERIVFVIERTHKPSERVYRKLVAAVLNAAQSEHLVVGAYSTHGQGPDLYKPYVVHLCLVEMLDGYILLHNAPVACQMACKFQDRSCQGQSKYLEFKYAYKGIRRRRRRTNKALIVLVNSARVRLTLHIDIDCHVPVSMMHKFQA